ncbi:MAG TPA: hypothetical protein VES73_03480 [Lamprocystis sp. (in: g-proteobacteria)]|nr:hypothetical protein [Lamprocystis sp. (in: g-proteobacteria)]
MTILGNPALSTRFQTIDWIASAQRRRPRRHAARVAMIGLIAFLILAGCAARLPDWARPGSGAAKHQPVATEQSGTSPAGVAKPVDLTVPPEPQWRTTRETLGLNEPAAAPVPVGQGAPVFTPFSQTLPELKREVASICGSARVNQQQDFLTPLVTDLYLSGVDPAFATEALIQGDCGSVPAVVRELAAQGGNAVVAAVVGRAVFLSGPGAEGTIRAAASKGLDRDLIGPMQRAEPSASPGTLAYSMAYFASRAPQSGVETAAAVDTLYSNATPGYGIYTFVLLGGAFDPAMPVDQARYQELLRVIETYVLAGAGGTEGPRTETHAFLVAVNPNSTDAKLSEQAGPELSADMRQDLAQYLRARNQPALAQRLETLPGPFLISSLEPRLLPTSEAAPRLVTDLSRIGSEYLYAVVDAYDRPVPTEEQGRPEGLSAIRDRLLGLFSRKVTAEELGPAIKDAWVFRFGGPPAAPPVVATPPAEAAPTAPVGDKPAPAAKTVRKPGRKKAVRSS